MRCYRFIPKQEEAEAIHIAVERACTPGATGYVDLDVPEGCLLRAAAVLLVDFRAFAFTKYGEMFAVDLDRRIAEFLSSQQEGGKSDVPITLEQDQYRKDHSLRAA